MTKLITNHQLSTCLRRQLIKRKGSGFTLVELLLAMGIMSILMTIIMRVFLQIIEMRLDSEAESAVAQDSRYVYSRLAYDIGRASSITTPANPGDTSSTIVLVIEGTTYTYAVDASGDLTVNDGTGPVDLTSAGTVVSSAIFTHVGDGAEAYSVQIDMDLESKIQRVRGPANFAINTTIGVR